jgi:hypothetical protein
MSSFDHPATVTVSQPANPLFAPIIVNIAANSSQTVDLTPYIDIIENKPPNQILNYGLLIKATKPIEAYYEVASLETNYNPELFVFKGKNALGTHFIIPGQTIYHNAQNYSPLPYFAFDIVAVNDSTTVTINPTKDLVGHKAGIPFNVILNRGQTYSAVSVGFMPLEHPNGSEVTSDKPIAITLKDDLLNGQTGCADLVGDQIVPVNIIGTEYNAVKGFLDEEEYIFVTATEDNTNLNVNGNSTILPTFNKGDVISINLASIAIHLESDKPVYVYQISGIGCELGSALLPHIRCTGSRQIAFTRTTAQQLSMMIFTTSDAIDGFTLNGNPGIIKSSDFASIPGTNNLWQYARYTFDVNTIPVNQTNIIINSKNFFHLGVLEGAVRTGCSYGFFSDYNSLNLGPDLSLCPGESAELDAGYGKDPYHWSTGSTSRSIIVSDSGTYWVTARLGNCEVSDTIHITLKSTKILNLGPDKTLCNGDSIVISAGDGFMSYKWNTGETDSSIIIRSTGIYTVETITPEGCIQRDTINIRLFNPKIKLSNLNTQQPCIGDTAVIMASPGFDEYDWYDASTGEKIDSGSYIFKAVKSGKYFAKAKTLSGCEAQSDTVEVIFNDSNILLSSIPPSNTGQLEFGAINVFDQYCISVKLTNFAKEPYILNNIFLKNNTSFSAPQSQFDMTFAPGETKDLILCFAPDSIGEYRDTLLITGDCINDTLLLHGDGQGNIYSAHSKCDVPVQLSTTDVIKEHSADLLPNPAEDFIYLEGKEGQLVQIYSLQGLKIIETMYKDRIDVNGLATGMYFVKIENKIYKFVKI